MAGNRARVQGSAPRPGGKRLPCLCRHGRREILQVGLGGVGHHRVRVSRAELGLELAALVAHGSLLIVEGQRVKASVLASPRKVAVDVIDGFVAQECGSPGRDDL